MRARVPQAGPPEWMRDRRMWSYSRVQSTCPAWAFAGGGHAHQPRGTSCASLRRTASRSSIRMYHGQVRDFLRSYVAALISALVLGVALILANSLPPAPGPNARRPTPAPQVFYTVRLIVDNREPTSLSVDREGKACDALSASERLKLACVLATNVDSRVIAGEAFGRLISPTHHIWRRSCGVRDCRKVRGFCRVPGLDPQNVARCMALTAQASYRVSDKGLTVDVPRGG